MGPLYPSEGTSKAFAQTYMNDPAMGDVAPLDLRMGRIYLPANTSKPDKKRVRELLDVFGQAICEHNPYVNDFVQVPFSPRVLRGSPPLYSRCLRAPQASQLTGKGDKKAKIVINADARPAPPDGDVPASSHERRYNPPSTYKGLHGNQTYGEVSVLMPDADVGGRDVVVQFHGGGIRRIHETHRSFDPLHFVLLFPAGDDGWKINMKKNGTQQSITPCDYYAYRIQWRVNDDGSNALLMSERLFQVRLSQVILHATCPLIPAVPIGILLQRLRQGRALPAAVATTQPNGHPSGDVSGIVRSRQGWRCRQAGREAHCPIEQFCRW